MIGPKDSNEMADISSCSDIACSVEQDYQKYSSLFVFAGGNKAGMEAMDKAKQAEVIYEMSKNSSFFKRAKELDDEAQKRAEQYQRSFDTLKGANLRRMECVAQNKLLEYEKRRNFDRICCVLDMDMFYAAVEIRDRPELRDLPVAVGGDSMISTSNYVARKYGVRAAMPGFIARKLCPNLVFVECNFDKYRIVAEQIRDIISKIDPQFHSHSLDEVYFDITVAATAKFHEANAGSYSRSPTIYELRECAANILQELRNEIKTKTNGLTCSAGIAHNFFLAKICADVNKPDGQYELPARREEVLDFLVRLPTRKVGGIGKVMEKILDNLGIKTVGDIRNFVPHILHAFKPASSEFLTRISIGVAEDEGKEYFNTAPEGAVTRKSIGCERTYSAKGISDPAELYRRLHEICSSLQEDMVRENLRGRAVTIKVKDINFHLHTRCQTTRSLIQTCESIEPIARQILDSFLPMRIRLLGVSVSKFDNAYNEQQCNPEHHQLKSLMASFLKPKESLERVEEYSKNQNNEVAAQISSNQLSSSHNRSSSHGTELNNAERSNKPLEDEYEYIEVDDTDILHAFTDQDMCFDLSNESDSIDTAATAATFTKQNYQRSDLNPNGFAKGPDFGIEQEENLVIDLLDDEEQEVVQETLSFTTSSVTAKTNSIMTYTKKPIQATYFDVENNDTFTSDSTNRTVDCPICGFTITGGPLAVSVHVDRCLQLGQSSSILTQSTLIPSHTNSKKRKHSELNHRKGVSSAIPTNIMDKFILRK